MTPKGMVTRPSSRTMAGMIVCIGRLPPASLVGVARLQGEARAAVVEQDAEASRWQSTAPKSAKIE
jgi:hypothetical protein